MKHIAFAALVLSLTSSALAGEVLIPAVYRGGGANGTLWRTEIVVSNVTTNPLVLPVSTTISFHRDNGETLEVHIPLSQMEVLAIPDAVHDWFSVENGG